MECLDRVELFVGNSKEKVGTFGKNVNIGNFTEKLPFSIEIDICTNNLNRFKLSFFLKTTNGESKKVDSKAIKYTPPRYFDDKALPPYCLKDSNISIALTKNVTDPEIYNHCIDMVEVCECERENHCFNCKKTYKHLGQILYQEKIENSTELLRLAYHRINPQKYRSKMSTMTNLKLEKGHCDEYFKIKESPALVYMIGGGVGCGVLLLIIIVVITLVLVKKKGKRENTEESVDKNPDYGYYQEGVEYEESALKDINEDYGNSVDDPDYMETGVTDTNMDYGDSVDIDEYPDNGSIEDRKVK
eukprot:GFUD01091541.1.p1 GENE.GFUD01091541.1~~GFUD01091541.1.p1  ORF type:complete len:321 (-),score=97.38 GFUD01091541.1:209-1114(-)